MKHILTLILTATLTFAAGPVNHREMVKTYGGRAVELEAKADRHEKEAERLDKASLNNPLRHKWPAMAAAPAERERRLAMQARRAASEARQLAAKHHSLSEQKLPVTD